MQKEKPNEFYTSTKISTPFKIFLGIILVAGLFLIGYLLYKVGEDWNNIVILMIGAILGVTLICYVISKTRRVHRLNNLAETERLYVDDLIHQRITLTIKKYIFPDVDIRPVLAFIIILGDILKKVLFYIFAGALAILIYQNDTFFNKAMMLLLAITWCPWVENLVLKKINFKLIFVLKLALTITIASIAIEASP